VRWWAVLRAILLVTMASLAQRQVALLAITKRTNGHECRTIRLLEAGRASSGTRFRLVWSDGGVGRAGTPDGNSPRGDSRSAEAGGKLPVGGPAWHDRAVVVSVMPVAADCVTALRPRSA
jgi:hypothetical protein